MLLSEPLVALLETEVDSLDKLELVMALSACTPPQARIGEIAARLDVARDDVRALVDDLAGILAIDAEDVVLAPTPGRRVLIDELARVYQVDRIELVRVIADHAMERLRDLADHRIAQALVRNRDRVKT